MALTAEETSKFVQAGDVRIHYHEAGTGPAVVCIHGGAPGAFGWGNFGRNMDALSQNFRTIIVDLPGFGKSDKPEITGGRYTFYARVFRDMFYALDIDKPHIVGLATGGGAGMKIALDYPDRVDRLVLVGSAGGVPIFSSNPSEGQKLIGSYYAAPGPSFEKMKAYLQMMIYDQSQISDALIQERYDASIEPAFMQSAPEGRGAPAPTEPIWKDMESIRNKTLIVWGRDNRVQGYDNALFMLGQIPDAQLHIFGRCGLWVPWEKAPEFNQLVRDFLLPE